MPRSDDDYIRFNPFDGDRDGDVKCRSVRLIKVRKPQSCFFGMLPTYGDQHMIQPGERARYEKALIDRSFWGRYYVCLPCMDKWLTEAFAEEDVQ